MSLSYQGSQALVYQGDAMEVLGTLPPESVHLCVTSPPYWGQRVYANAESQSRIWGGDPQCQHSWGTEMVRRDRGAAKGATAQTGNQLREVSGVETRMGNFCALCGAWKGALGSEPTPLFYVQHIVEVFRAVRRVLRADGVCFINLGDSRAGSWGNMSKTPFRGMPEGRPVTANPSQLSRSRNLCGIPWRVAFALQEDGWQLIDAIIWAKENTMPESVKDRCTKSYDFIFMLTKTTETLGWIHPTLGAVRKPAKQPEPDYVWQQVKGLNFNVRVRDAKAGRAMAEEGYQASAEELDAYEEWHEGLTVQAEQNTPPEGWTVKNKMGWRRLNRWRGFGYWYDGMACRQKASENSHGGGQADPERKNAVLFGVDAQTGLGNAQPAGTLGANLRNVWEFATEALGQFRFNGRVFNHFAAFPRELPKRAILLACPAYCCPQCGAGWRRVVARGALVPDAPGNKPRGNKRGDSLVKNAMTPAGSQQGHPNFHYEEKTIGFQPSCGCSGNTLETAVRGTVLDPFAGAGTSLLAARELGRKGIGIDLSQDYVALTTHRLAQEQPTMMPVTEEVIDG